ncbi:plasmid replication protein, partial [Listeria monocytogenes]
MATKRLLFSDKLSNWRSLSFFIGKIVRIKNGKGDLLMLVNDAIYTYSAVINTVVHEGLTAY